jgi:hypothetical protein
MVAPLWLAPGDGLPSVNAPIIVATPLCVFSYHHGATIKLGLPLLHKGLFGMVVRLKYDAAVADFPLVTASFYQFDIGDGMIFANKIKQIAGSCARWKVSYKYAHGVT